MSMRARLQGPLRMFFQVASPAADTECPTLEAPPVPIVELTVYAGDSVAFGRLALTADRVTDLMNERTEFEFVDTYLHSLDEQPRSASQDGRRGARRDLRRRGRWSAWRSCAPDPDSPDPGRAAGWPVRRQWEHPRGARHRPGHGLPPPADEGGKLLSARRGAGAAMTGRRAGTAYANVTRG